MKNLILMFLLKLLVKQMDVDRDQPVYIVFKGNDEIEIQEPGKPLIKHQF